MVILSTDDRGDKHNAETNIPEVPDRFFVDLQKRIGCRRDTIKVEVNRIES